MLGRLYRRLGTRYFSIYVVFEVVSAFVVCLATVGIFSLYTETSPGEFWRVAAVAEGAVAVAVGWVMARAWQLTRPVIRWVADGGPACRPIRAKSGRSCCSPRPLAAF